MNSNSFMRVQVRVQKKYFFKFEFGKMIEFKFEFSALLSISTTDFCQESTFEASCMNEVFVQVHISISRFHI